LKCGRETDGKERQWIGLFCLMRERQSLHWRYGRMGCPAEAAGVDRVRMSGFRHGLGSGTARISLRRGVAMLAERNAIAMLSMAMRVASLHRPKTRRQSASRGFLRQTQTKKRESGWTIS